MQYYLGHITDELQDMIVKLSAMSLVNIEWAAMYSGTGILNILSEKDAKKLPRIGDGHRAKEISQNFIPIKCIYKKSKPVFVKASDAQASPNSYIWDSSSLNKEITPSSQALAVLSLCRAAQILKNTDPLLGILMLRAAGSYYDFITSYLKNENGLFVAAENKTKFINDELNIKLDKNDAKLIDQVFIHEALLYLYYVTSDDTSKDYNEENSSRYLNESRSLFRYIFNNCNILPEESTRDISLCISSMTRCCSLEKDVELKANFQNLTALMCAELESRIKVNGEVEKNFDDLFPASLITHFRVISAFLDGYIETGIEKFKDLAFKIYRFVENLYDYTTELYVWGDTKKIKYSIRDIGEVIKCLSTLYLMNNDSKILDTLLRFYRSSIEGSGIFQCSPRRTLSFSGNNATIPDNIPLVQEVNKAPVFLKSYRINLKKNLASSVSKHFNSYYAFYASYLVLYYLEPIMEAPKPAVNETATPVPEIETVSPIPINI